ncbi:MAG TPA: two-component sensor histidine kinase, partial [Jiangellaceae bacterium]
LQAWGEPARGSQFRLTLPLRAREDLTSSPISLVPEDAMPDARVDSVGEPYRRLAPAEGGRDGSGARRSASAGTEAGRRG